MSAIPTGFEHRVRERLGHFVRIHWDRMVSFARSVAPQGNEALAEELVQDALAGILETGIVLPESDHEALAIMRQRIRNLGSNLRRRERIRRAEPLDAEGITAGGAASDPWRQAWRTFAARDLDLAMTRLTMAERDVADLHVLEEWTFEEIAGHRGSSIRTVKELNRRARRKLRETLEARYGMG